MKLTEEELEWIRDNKEGLRILLKLMTYVKDEHLRKLHTLPLDRDRLLEEHAKTNGMGVLCSGVEAVLKPRATMGKSN